MKAYASAPSPGFLNGRNIAGLWLGSFHRVITSVRIAIDSVSLTESQRGARLHWSCDGFGTGGSGKEEISKPSNTNHH
jgi:hypothetical protein